MTRIKISIEIDDSQENGRVSSVERSFIYDYPEEMDSIGWRIGEEIATCLASLDSEFAKRKEVFLDSAAGFQDGIDDWIRSHIKE